MANSSQTEKPTAKRLLKARTEGQFTNSRQLITAFQFLAFVTIAFAWFPSWLAGMKELLRTSLVEAFRVDITIATLPAVVEALVTRAFIPVGVISVTTAGLTLALHLGVTKLGFSLKKLIPDIKRFNSLGKIKNMAHEGPMAALQAASMLIIFSGAIYSITRRNASLFFALPFTSLETGLITVGASIKDLLWKAVGLFLLFGFVDLWRQQRRFMNSLKMTKQEVKQEAKDNEGSPHVKGKIKRMQREMARRRMMKDVATATAVIVNPTHFAVALRYDHATMATPRVVAKGKNYLALRIRQLAIENGVPLIENPPLAQALYKSVDLGKEIPAHLYRAVAEVLAYIYRLTHSRK
jgi:flagellar biosynthetic protein FlhB